MVQFQLKINHPSGLSPRIAAELVSEANRYKSEITLVYGEDSCDLKSIMNVLGTIGPNDQDTIIIRAEGVDEAKVQEGFIKCQNALHF